MRTILTFFIALFSLALVASKDSFASDQQMGRKFQLPTYQEGPFGSIESVLASRLPRSINLEKALRATSARRCVIFPVNSKLGQYFSVGKTVLLRLLNVGISANTNEENILPSKSPGSSLISPNVDQQANTSAFKPYNQGLFITSVESCLLPFYGRKFTVSTFSAFISIERRFYA